MQALSSRLLDQGMSLSVTELSKVWHNMGHILNPISKTLAQHGAYADVQITQLPALEGAWLGDGLTEAEPAC